MNAKKIAEIAHVSRSTVQRVLANHPSVAVDTRERVIEVARSVGYTPNRVAKALVMKRQGLKYSVILPGNENPFFEEVRRGLDDASSELKEYGITVSIDYIDMENIRDQVSLIGKRVSEGYTGIVLSTFDTPEIQKAIDSGAESGVSFVSLVTPISSKNCLCFVGQDNLKSGAVAARLMANTTSPKGRILCLCGSRKYLSHQDRIESFIKHYGSISPEGEIIGVFENREKNALSFDILEKVLGNGYDIDGIFIAGAGVEGVCDYIDARNFPENICIICYDLIESHKSLCSSGMVTYIIDQEPYNEGYRSLRILNNFIMFDVIPENLVRSRIDIRVKENIEE